MVLYVAMHTNTGWRGLRGVVTVPGGEMGDVSGGLTLKEEGDEY